MDELYDNLEDYEDINNIEQLKNENIELKNKLEEYAIAMDKLQKDFDRVSSDFKKMEMNYSSLLKTAKVEIERKTKIIKDLNIEKDMIVLKVLQNKNQLNIRSLKNITKPYQKAVIKTDSNLAKKCITPSADNPKAKIDTGLSGRKEDGRLSSIDTVTTCNTDISGRLLKLAGTKDPSVEPWSDRTSDTKENMAKKDTEDSSSTNTRALSIKNRRKSLPAVRSQVIYSSDEECEDTGRFETYKKGFPQRDDKTRQNIDTYNERYRHKGLDERNKVSETSSVDDRYSGYERRDTYHRSRNDRSYGSDKYKSRERYDSNQRYRRHLSPDRSRRPTRTDDYYQRQEYSRRRFLESPPLDKFPHYQQRNRESNSKLERDNSFDRKDRQPETYLGKHKINAPYEGPVTKRPRTDSINKYPEEEQRWVRDKGVALERTVSDLLEEMPVYTTCQSPDDYLFSDDSSPHPVKEIMNTASTPLEDPRTKSKTYVLKTVDNNTELSTITGRNVELKKVSESKWVIDKNSVNVPKALTRRPSQCSDEIVKEIYRDIDNPVSNMSVESGEILTCNEDEPGKLVEQSKYQLQSAGQKADLKAFENNVDQTKPICTDNIVKSTYRIPKLKSSSQDKPIQNSNLESASPLALLMNLSGGRSNDCKSMKTRADNDSNKVILKANNDLDKANINFNKDKRHGSLKQEQKLKDSLVTKEMIEGDLELSDETCDNDKTEMKEKTVIESIPSKIKDSNDRTQSDVAKMTEHQVPDSKISSKDSEKHCSQINPTDLGKKESKKQRSKKKSSKAKEADSSDEVKQDLDKIKRDKAKKDKKTKFSELFGDSNSVITAEEVGSNSLISPDDLGIATDTPGYQQSIDRYIPIFEDAQDAVDLNVPKSLNVQALSLTKTNELIESQNSNIEKPQKNKSKSAETKKRKSRRSESETVVSIEAPTPPINELYPNMMRSVPEEEERVIISPIEPPSQVSGVNATNKTPQEPAEKLSLARNVLTKSDGLMKALATSTPQKVLHEPGSDVGVVCKVDTINSTNEHVSSVEPVAGYESSTTDTVESHQDADVPDVRIFVKRRRRVIRKP